MKIIIVTIIIIPWGDPHLVHEFLLLLANRVTTPYYAAIPAAGLRGPSSGAKYHYSCNAPAIKHSEINNRLAYSDGLKARQNKFIFQACLR